MLLFFFLTMPLFMLFSFWLYKIGKKNITIQIAPFLKGLLWFVISVLVLFIFHNRQPGSFKTAPLFFYYFFNHHALSLIAALTGYFIFHGFYYNYKKDDKFVQSLFFLGGYYTLLPFFYSIQYYNMQDFYTAFIIPVMNCTVVLLTSLFIDKIYNAYGKIRILYGFFIVLIPVILSFISMLFAYNLIPQCFLAGCLFLGLSYLIYFLVKDL